MKRTAVIIIALIVLGLSVWQVYRGVEGRDGTVRAPEPSAPARLEKIETKISAPGIVESDRRDILKAQGTAVVDTVLVKVNSAVSKNADLVTFKNKSKPVRAPYDGIISKVLTSSGDTVNPGQPLIEIFDSNNFLTTIMADELDLPRIKTGQAVQITVNAFPGKVFAGKVTDISQEGRTTNGIAAFPVTIVFEETNGIRVGMTTEATIVTAVKEEALVIPVEAVNISEGEKFVIVENPNGTTETRKVETGLCNNIMAEITGGLEEGEVVRLPQAANNLFQQFMPGGFPVQGGINNSGISDSPGEEEVLPDKETEGEL